MSLSPFSSRLALLLDGETVSWVHVKKKFSREMISCGTLDLKRDDAQSIRKSLPEHASQILLILPRQEVLTKSLKIPSESPYGIQDILESKLSEDLPYGMNEIVYATASLRSLEPGSFEVRILWALKKGLEEKLEMLRRYGLEPDKIICVPQALLAHYAELKRRDPLLPENVLLLHSKQTGAELALIEDVNLVITRTLKNETPGRLPQTDEWKAEWQSLSETLSKEGLAAPQAVVISGAPEQSPFTEALGQISKIPVIWLDSREKELLKTPGHPDAYLAGLALADPAGLPDLSPADHRNARLKKKNHRLLNQIFLIAVVFIGLGLSALGLRVAAQSVEKGKLLRFTEELSPEAKRIVQIARRLKVSVEFQRKKQVPLDFLGALPSLLPPEITLTQMEYDEGSGFQIRGTGTRLEEISNLLKAIKKLPYITKAEFDHSSRKKQGSNEYIEFQISLSVTQTGSREN